MIIGDELSCHGLKLVIFYNSFTSEFWEESTMSFGSVYIIGFKDRPFILEICKHQQLKVKGIMVSPTKHHVVILMMQVVTQNWKESV